MSDLKKRIYDQLMLRADKTLTRAENMDSLDINHTVLKAHELYQAARMYLNVFGNEPEES